MTAQKDGETERDAASTASAAEAFSFKGEYEDALSASGLVDGVDNWRALDPLPHRILEGEYLCHRGDTADRLWVIVSGSIAVRNDGKTLYVRRENEVVGELGILNEKGYRFYDLVANEGQVLLFAVQRDRIIGHKDVNKIWRNVAKILSLKLISTTSSTALLVNQVQSDARILRAYTNEYALSRRLQSGGRFLTDHRVDTAVIWFSDVSDFSGIVLKLSPVRAADFIQQFFNVQAEAIHHHGGHIDKFMGDGLMAFWILPEDTAAARKRICEEVADAAIMAETAVGRLHLGARALNLRIGLHVGQVLSGDFGSATRHQFTLIGAEVNKAARLEQATSDNLDEKNMKIGNVRVSQDYYQALSDAYKARFPNKACLMARNIGDLTLYS